MPPLLDVFVLGKAADSPSIVTRRSAPFPLNLFFTEVAAPAGLPGTTWARQLADGDGDLAALVVDDSPASLKSVVMMAALVSDDSAATVMVEPVVPGDSPFDPTQAVIATFGVNVLLAPRAGLGPVLFRRSRYNQVGPLRAVAEPVWDWLIRAIQAGEKVGTEPISPELRSGDCRLPLLAPPRPGQEADWLRDHLTVFSPANFGIKPESALRETALRAGLFQWHDFLDESHRFSQSIKGQGQGRPGDYWHAIMHRREPDYANAKYWFRQIGPQEIYRELRRQADSIFKACAAPEANRWCDRLQHGGKWDPFAFVDLCEECAADETADLALAARRIQYLEMSLLMRLTCWRGGSA